MQWLCVGRSTHVVNSSVKRVIRYWSFIPEGETHIALFGKRADSAVYISIIMATKSGKAKSKSRYTDVHTILEEIDQESETEIVGGWFI